jgi:uncharacterized protein
MQQATHRMLPDGRRLHLQHGPIDLIVEAWGAREEVAASYRQAVERFETVLTELVGELPRLREPVDGTCRLRGTTARRMWRATVCHLPRFVTPMAAVAGAVADEVVAAMTRGRDLRRAYVNNGGDIALYFPTAHPRESGTFPQLGESHIFICSGLTRASMGEAECKARGSSGQARGRQMRIIQRTSGGMEDRGFRIGLVVDPGDPRMPGAVEITADMPVRGIATSGRHGRSLSLGIADSVTVLAANAAAADAAATLIANAVDLPGHPAVSREPACHLDPDSDLGQRLVTTGVGQLSADEIDAALAAGADEADDMIGVGLIYAAVLVLGPSVRLVGNTGAEALRSYKRENRVHA